MKKSVIVSIPNQQSICVSLDYEVDINLLKSQQQQSTSSIFWLDWCSEEHVRVRFRLLGGKGGFGSNLRAQGSKMSSKRRKLGNEACRDLSGQRVRTINQNKLIEEYLKRQPEMERKREAEIRDKMLKAVEAPTRKPVFSDVDYLRTSREMVDTIESAVYEALLGNETESDNQDDNEECINEECINDDDNNEHEHENEIDNDDNDKGKEKEKEKEPKRRSKRHLDKESKSFNSEHSNAGPSTSKKILNN